MFNSTDTLVQRADDRPPPAIGRFVWIAPAIIGAATLLTHLWCLWDGTVLDDWWHQRQLRMRGWSIPELIASTRIELTDFTHHWWQDKPVYWEYARPVFTGTMKFVYRVVGGDNPVALHAFSVLLHFVSACFVVRLGWLLTRRSGWAIVGGLLFVTYPHAVISVQWPSAQNAVLHTMFMLAALLLYVRASGLDLYAGMSNGANERIPTDVAPRSLRRGAFSAAILFWLLALFTRENALMLPVILLSLDMAFGGVRTLRARWPAYALFAATGVLFLAWRVITFRAAMPDVYVRLPAGEGIEYPLWAIAKLLHYLCTSVWLAPMTIGPTGRFNPWMEAPGDCTLMIMILIILGGGYLAACRRTRGFWIWPLWIFLAVLPVVPVVATPHSGYACGVGFAIATALSAGASAAYAPWMRRAAARVAVFFLVGQAVMSLMNRWQWTGTIAAERIGIEAVRLDPPDASVTDVFLINQPFVAVYNPVALAQTNRLLPGARRYHVLTYAPDPFMMDRRCIVKPIDSHRIRVEAIGQPYFSRLLGRFLTEGFRKRGAFHAGEAIDTGEFRATIVRADASGVWELEFAFTKPLDDPRYCFYVVTENCGALRRTFAAGNAGNEQARDPKRLIDLVAVKTAGVRLCTALGLDEFERVLREKTWFGASPPAAQENLDYGSSAHLADARAAVELLFDAAFSEDAGIRVAAESAFRPAASYVLSALCVPEQFILSEATFSREDWTRLIACWEQRVDTRVLHVLRRHARELTWLIKRREELPHARMHAARIIRTDLYLTGKPFPASREDVR